ncbi:MAG: type I DNA topoisomerase [Clostridia bacterium]|nr:type I DNA topoisomerase [Clostridia bacterium]
MANNLVILESPGKIGAVKSYLGSNYKVIASVGHVRDLPKSTLGIDIDNGFAPHYINIRGKGDLIKELRKEAKNADKIFFATDPDREGEAISWHLAAILGDDAKKAKRVTFNEITKSAVKEAIKHPRSIDMNLVNSQQARRILDRIVGYQISPFLWKTVKSGLSAGRVQSVATKIIVDREEEIKSFVPQEYWTITAELKNQNKQLLVHYYGGKDKRLKIENKAQADKILADVNGKSFVVDDIKTGVKRRAPQPPFITSTLQQEASRKLNFQSQRTMKIAQELYEGVNLGSEFGGVHGLITYMRTDSLRVSQEAQVSAREYIEEKYGKDYRPEKPRVYKTKSNAQDAHEAIRPSKVGFEPSLIKKHLTNDQFKLYKLIWDRFLASQMSSAVVDTVVADFENSGHIFRASGYTVRFKGYTAIYTEYNESTSTSDEEQFSFDKNNKLPELSVKEGFDGNNVNAVQHFTEPPLRYDEASLIKFLEEKGIGRPSTYTPIITVILSRGYVSRDGRFLVPTQLGEIITKIMAEHFPDILNYKFTANMENNLDTIESGKVALETVLDGFYKDFKKELDKAADNLKNESVEVPVEETDIICELCGSKMIIKNGRFGKFAACPNYPKCKNTKTLDKDGKIAESKPVEKAEFKCELCGSDMILRKGRYGDFYACANYPKCKNTKTIEGKTEQKCPKCGAEIVKKQTKSKKQFYSCTRYPQCDFSTWDTPTDKICPTCGGMLLEKKNRIQHYLYCHNKECGYKMELKDENK